MLEYVIDGKTVTLNLKGSYIGYDDEAAKSRFFEAVKSAAPKEVVIEAAHLQKWDSTLVVILYELAGEAARRPFKIVYRSFPENLQRLIALALAVDRKPEKSRFKKLPWVEFIGARTLIVYNSILKGLGFIRKVMHSVVRFMNGRAIMRKVDFLFAMEDCSYKAVGIVALVSFMVGLILAFVGAIQLKTFGAQIYVASLVAIGMTRIMGAIMVGIIMAGRTGASYAATIGTMQVNEEIDALKTMGIPIADFLVLPRIMALTLTMPFLTILADAAGVAGGAAVGVFMLGIPAPEYWKYSFDALNMTNFWVGIFHGFVFGIVIALCGCYYGVNCGRNADSVGIATTKAVVSAIVWMIVMTGIITWIFEALGI